MIAWTDFTWEAFATLVTGLSAVFAAWLIGTKQVGIAERQVAINERQAEIADQQRQIIARQVDVDAFRLKSELFDLRYEVYQATRTIITKIMTTGYPLDIDVITNFIAAHDQSRFLFRASVHADLQEIWAKHCARETRNTMMTHNFNTTGDYGADLVEADYQSSLWFNDRLTRLSELFGDELTLSLGPAAADLPATAQG